MYMVHQPSSKSHGFLEHELVPGGSEIPLTLDNIEEYIRLQERFILHDGIITQLNALREGFCKVFLMEKLSIFTPDELQLVLCGEQDPQWTLEDLMMYTEPKYGFTKESPTFIHFVNVLLEMTADQKKVRAIA